MENLKIRTAEELREMNIEQIQEYLDQLKTASNEIGAAMGTVAETLMSMQLKTSIVGGVEPTLSTVGGNVGEATDVKLENVIINDADIKQADDNTVKEETKESDDVVTDGDKKAEDDNNSKEEAKTGFRVMTHEDGSINFGGENMKVEPASIISEGTVVSQEENTVVEGFQDIPNDYLNPSNNQVVEQGYNEVNLNEIPTLSTESGAVAFEAPDGTYWVSEAEYYNNLAKIIDDKQKLLK